ncbi:hypothetical protein RE474_02595 [Methanolobus sediminis]|uniref:Uncharacterized protein n=1 Tax=Methanolobus sediminis TaxID=3072978 RepID=A0AA51YJJ9_9EURY|nr:hypothetical protein [Methanolobus sediminis]WMW25630.1 hypothetical protein RE474_02595 [Methanolobus sediminis]
MMNRMEIILVVLCVLLLTTVGVSAADDQQKLPPKYRVIQFDVTYSGEVVGELSINTNQWTYVLNAHGLEPGTEYYFYSLGRFPQISTGTANENGDLHLKGEWPQEINIIENELSAPKFIVSTIPLTGIIAWTPQLTAKCHIGLFQTSVWGTLTDSNGNPLPGQTIRVEGYVKKTDTWSVWYSIETDAYGTFKKTKFGTPDSLLVRYQGGEYDGTLYLSTWVVPTLSAVVPAF